MLLGGLGGSQRDSEVRKEEQKEPEGTSQHFLPFLSSSLTSSLLLLSLLLVVVGVGVGIELMHYNDANRKV